MAEGTADQQFTPQARIVLTRKELVVNLLNRYEVEGLSGVIEISFHNGVIRKVAQTEVL